MSWWAATKSPYFIRNKMRAATASCTNTQSNVLDAKKETRQHKGRQYQTKFLKFLQIKLHLYIFKNQWPFKIKGYKSTVKKMIEVNRCY